MTDKLGKRAALRQQKTDQLLEDMSELLAHRFTSRVIPPKPRMKNPLPPADVDLTPYFENTVPKDFQGPKVQHRGDIIKHAQTIRSHFRGYPEIFPLFMLSIACLRRYAPYSDQALVLFFRIIETDPNYFAQRLTPRYIVSVLRTLAEFGRTPEEKYVALSGYVYASLVRAYEVERKLSGQSQDQLSFALDQKGADGGLKNFYYIPAKDDALSNVHECLIEAGLLEENIASPFVLAILAEIKFGDNLFSRIDRELPKFPDRAKRPNCWSFGRPEEFRDL